ncbi:hypothetical protein FE773_07645 [Caminibacter mediatlanticus TB-2]|uniref:Uncharacterized protein n=1 Tax=Caminibacter mediatlanticus TB-2 TaxID=391592 RepID=A0AAI9AIS8_9BACT|nr:hypothetical protein [Caminibacter mediatlanticus]EDM24418.1 hypothetical protein CMTB2_02843 [Caminibacter mediatlanticus TB-2]QCT95064.1 hypothetical protein FE773_07645 [Caminibacter mediatlanticus TB-2]
MIAFFSFLLTLIIYLSLIFFFFFNIIPNVKKEKKVLIHTAIIVPSKNKSIKQTINKENKKISVLDKKIVKVEKKVTKKVKKGSKTNITKGGDVNFNDIFKSVNDNINSTPLKLQKQEEMSRLKGITRKVEKVLKKVKDLNVDISIQSKTSNNMSDKEVNETIQKIGKIWYKVSNLPGEYAKINVVSKDGKIYVIILDSNLDEAKQKELISGIKSLIFNKNFNFNITFNTKVNR